MESRPPLSQYTKYIGSKAKLAPHIRKLYWTFFSKHTFVDLFCGSGAMSFTVNAPKTVMWDGNESLINLHKVIQSGSFPEYIDFTQHETTRGFRYLPWSMDLEEFKEEWEADKTAYNNRTYEGAAYGDEERAVLYYRVLLGTMNGICRGSGIARFNGSPAYSSFQGQRVAPYATEHQFKALSKNPQYMQDWVIERFIYEEMEELTGCNRGAKGYSPNIFLEGKIREIKKIEENSKVFLYVDPPYDVEDKEGKPGTAHCYYGETPFSEEDQYSLLEYAKEAEHPVILSNNATTRMKAFCDDLSLPVYHWYRDNTISSKASSRDEIKPELIILNEAAIAIDGVSEMLGAMFKEY